MTKRTRNCLVLLAMALSAASLNSLAAFRSAAAPQSNAGNPETPPGSPACGVGTSEYPAALANVRELQSLMAKYFMVCRADLSIIDSVFEEEPRDGLWAGPLEERIKQAAAAEPGLKVSGQCRRSLCRIDFEAADIEYCYALVLKFSLRLRPLLKGTVYAVGGVYVPMLPRGYREYFYSELLPPVFLESFRQRMGN